MNPGDSISRELGPLIEERDAAALDEVSERLKREEARPAASFRTRLRAHLSRLSGTPEGPPPRRLRLLIGAYAGCGIALLALATLLSTS
jgi:hypothetical protein